MTQEEPKKAISPLTSGQKKKEVHFLLTQLGSILLAKSPVHDALQKASELHLGKLKMQLTEDEYRPLLIMRDAITQLAHKLVNCRDVEQLDHAYAYLRALNDGQVMVAVENAETGQIDGYGMNQ